MGRKRDKRAKNNGGSKPLRRPLALHRLFGFVLGLWGAALGGLVTLVLPRNLVLEVAANAGLAGIGVNAPFVLAAIAALVLGVVMLAIAGLITRASGSKARRAKDTPSLAALAVRRVQTIDPASELGSRRLDDPIEVMPFAGLKPEFEAEDEAEAEVAQAAPEPVLQAVAPAPRPLSPSAIERLRAVPTSELSLVQMVERFAAALHEHQSAAPGQGPQRADQAGREAALAEALKALAAFSPDESSSARGEPLRAALTRLQELRGAA